MNLELIETPTNQRGAALPFAEQRRKIRDQADGCEKWLKIQGYSVQRIEPGPVCPRIVIHTSPLCDQLEGAIGGFERSQQGECRYSFVYRFGCEVRWYAHSTGSGRTGLGAVMATVGALSARFARKIGVAA